MNTDQVTGIVRALAPAILAYAVGRGWIPQSMVADLSAALVTIAAAVWSVYSNKSGKTIS